MPFWRKKPPAPRTSVPGMEPLVRCLQLSTKHHHWSPGATVAELRYAEQQLGRRIPPVLHALHEMSNGAGLVGGNLNFYPLMDHKKGFSLTRMMDMLRSWEWKLPDEVVMFADNGGESLFGYWLPRKGDPDAPCLVLEFDMGSCDMAIAGTNLLSFINGWVANYLLVEDAPLAALDALGLPRELHPTDFSEEEFARITRWADPDIPDSNPDPHARPVTFEEVRERYGR